MVKDHSDSEKGRKYLRLYGIRHMVKDHSDSEKGRKYLRLYGIRHMVKDHSDSVYIWLKSVSGV